MPYLTPEERNALLGPIGTCPTCAHPLIRCYCRSCDEFFAICSCTVDDADAEHWSHRLYLWTPYGVMAIEMNAR